MRSSPPGAVGPDLGNPAGGAPAAEGPATPRWRWRLPARSVATVAWLVVVVVATLLVVRVAPFDPRVPALWLITFLPLAVAATTVVLPVALVLRRRALAATTAVVLLAAGVVYAGDWGDGPQPAPPGWPTLRVLSANVLFTNPTAPAVVDQVVRADPDVVVLQEVTAAHRAALDDAGLFARYPNVVVGDDLTATLVASRLPLRDAEILDVGGHGMPSAVVVTDAGEVDLIGVHVAPPLRGTDRWSRQLARLDRLAAERARPLLVGDFNATSDHHAFRRLLAGPRVDAHQEAGSGFGMTWPIDHRVVPTPILRIDHVVVGEGLAVLDADARRDPGSDHRLLVVDLAVAPDAGDGGG